MRLKKGKKSPNGPGPLGGGGASATYDQLTSAKGKGRKKKATEDEKDADFVPDKRSPTRRKTRHASKAAGEEEAGDQGDSEPEIESVAVSRPESRRPAETEWNQRARAVDEGVGAAVNGKISLD